MFLSFPRPFAQFAVHQLAAVDYTVANRVTDDVATLVDWAYSHDAAWMPPIAIQLLHSFDDLGSVLILLVAWIVNHTS